MALLAPLIFLWKTNRMVGGQVMARTRANLALETTIQKEHRSSWRRKSCASGRREQLQIFIALVARFCRWLQDSRLGKKWWAGAQIR